MDIDRSVDLLAAGAGVAGLAVALLMWRRTSRTLARRQSRHPSASVPVALSIAERPDGPHLRVAVDQRWPSMSIDIVTFHRSGSDDNWTSEPIVDPIEVAAGMSTIFDTVLPDAVGPYDVVLGWTTHHPTGDAPGSATLTAPAPPSDGDTGGDGVRPFRLVYAVAASLLALIGFVAVLQFIDGDTSRAESDNAPSATESAQAGGAPAATPAPADSPPPTAAASTTVTSTSSSVAASSTAPSTTAPATSTSTTVADGPRVEIDGQIEDCRFGADCVIASFRVVDFEGSGEYVCEFDDGSRFVFRYVGDGADDACARSGPNPTITIEVDGVRSATISRESLQSG